MYLETTTSFLMPSSPSLDLINVLYDDRDISLLQDRELMELVQANLKFIDSFNIDVYDTRHHSIHVVYNQTLDIAKSHSKRQTVAKLKDKLAELEVEYDFLRETWKSASADMKKNAGFKAHQMKVKQYVEHSKKLRENIKTLEERLNSVGYHTAISEEAMRAKENEISVKKSKISELEDSLSVYEDVVANEASLVQKTNALKLEFEQCEALFRRLSLG